MFLLCGTKAWKFPSEFFIIHHFNDLNSSNEVRKHILVDCFGEMSLKEIHQIRENNVKHENMQL